MREKTLTNQLSVKDNTTNEGYPLDSRDRINGLEDLVSMSGAYEGMHVYNLDDGKEYVITEVENGDVVMDSVIPLEEFVNSKPDAVLYTEQTLNSTQQARARQNIGAGTSNFSGNYNDLINKPAIPDVSNKVDKVTGKGLSTNDYTDTDKTKVNNAIQTPSATENDKIPVMRNGSITWEEKPSNGQDGAQGPKGNDGADAVNPFKGYYPSGVSKPDTGAVGDYLYAPPSDSQSTATATVWHYDSTQTPPWTDTEIDVSAVVGVKFGSGQAVTAIKIKDENGVEVQGNADVLSAGAGKKLNTQVDGLSQELHNINIEIDGEHLPTPVAGQITSQGKWNLAENTSHYAIAVSPNDVIRIKANSSNKSVYTFLKSYPDTIIVGVNVDFATGYDSTVDVITNQDSGDIYAPVDANFLFLVKDASAVTDRTPAELYINGVNMMSPNGIKGNIEKNATNISNLVAHISTVNAELEEYQNKTNGKIDGVSLPPSKQGQISNSGTWLKTENTTHWAIPIYANDVIQIKANSIKTAIYTFLKTYPDTIVAGRDVDFATGYTSVISLTVNADTGNLNAPNDAHYLYVVEYASASNNKTPVYIYINGVDIMLPNGINNKLNNIDVRLEDLEYSNVPSYFDENLADALPIIQENNIYSGFRGDSFIFTTDTHIPLNTGLTPSLAKYIADRTNNSVFIHGGDVINGGNDVTKTQAESTLRDFVNAIKLRFGKNFRIVFGNHDANQANQADTSQRLTQEEFYAIVNKPYENEVTFGIESSNKQNYYYWDNTAQGIRYFVLDYSKGLSSTDAQYSWVSEHIDELSSAWRVVIITHIVLEKISDEYYIPSNYNEFVSMIESYGDKVIGVIGGHVHYDAIVYTPSLGIPFISCYCDLTTDTDWDTRDNTLTTVDIDITSECFRLVRIGRRSGGWGTDIGKTVNFRNSEV